MTSRARSATVASQAVNASSASSSLSSAPVRPLPNTAAVAAQARGSHQPLHEAQRLVALVERQPRHDRRARQRLAAPLAQQRGLAEPGRRLHRDHRLVLEAGCIQAQALPRQQAFAQARRRCLQHQFGRCVVVSHGCCSALGGKATRLVLAAGVASLSPGWKAELVLLW